MNDRSPALASPGGVALPEHWPVELHVWPRDDGPVGADEVVGFLCERRVVAVVRDGSGDGCVAVTLAAREDDRVLASVAGDLQPGPTFEEVARDLARATGSDVVVDWVVVLTPDDTHRMPDDLPALPQVARTLLAWRASAACPVVVRALAQTVGAPVEHATVDGWTVVALEDEALHVSLDDLPVGAASLPVVELARRGHERRVRWYDRARLAPVTGMLGVATRPAVVLDDAPDMLSSHLAVALGDSAYRNVHGTGRIDATTRTALENLPLVPETLLVDAASALGLPTGLAELVEGAERCTPGASSPWLTAPGTTLVEPEGRTRNAIARGMYAMLTEEPQGDGWYARFRRWLWHRPGMLVAISAAEVALGAALVCAAATGTTLAGAAWPLWAAGAVVLLDGVPDLANGALLLRLKARRSS